MAMTEYEKVPWSCREEWEFCRDRLFGDNRIMQHKALEHLYLWKIRNYNLPVAVECTLILMEAKIREPLLKSGNTPDMSVAMWYSTPIMRFINLVTDSSVGVRNPNSMMDFAKQLGIPDWIVELRHTAAHSHSLPRLSKMKEATDICLTWLQDNYWYKNLSNCNAESEEFRNSAIPINRYFDAYTTIKLHLLRGCNKVADMSADERDVVCSIMPEKIRQEKENAMDSWLLKDAYEVVFKKLSRLVDHEEHAKKLIDRIVTSNHPGLGFPADVQNDKFFISPNLLKDNEFREIALKKWADLLNILCNSTSCFYLLQKLLRIIGDELEFAWSKKCASVYVNTILEAICFCKEKENRGITRLTKKRKLQHLEDNHGKPNIVIVNITIADEQVKKLMRIIIEHPNQFSETILKNLSRISNCDAHLSAHNTLAQLISINAGKSIHMGQGSLRVSGSVAPKIHTAQELKELLGVTGEPLASECIDSPTEKTLVEEKVWRNVPFGLLPGQTEFRLWMKIYETDDD